jgi:hypothetical protein
LYCPAIGHIDQAQFSPVVISACHRRE